MQEIAVYIIVGLAVMAAVVLVVRKWRQISRCLPDADNCSGCSLAGLCHKKTAEFK